MHSVNTTGDTDKPDTCKYCWGIYVPTNLTLVEEYIRTKYFTCAMCTVLRAIFVTQQYYYLWYYFMVHFLTRYLYTGWEIRGVKINISGLVSNHKNYPLYRFSNTTNPSAQTRDCTRVPFISDNSPVGERVICDWTDASLRVAARGRWRELMVDTSASSTLAVEIIRDTAFS